MIACIAGAALSPAAASDRKVTDTHMRGTDAFSQNKEAARLLRRLERSEAKKENRRNKAPKQVRSISPNSNRY